ncbi:glucose-6-phosphate isomerase [Pseudohalioglobus sediminis]|uniref:Glucose-6-phosphate isomerase n=1 Tax=Pseudohalioglobus sediminis TaxID=2606449 RepID=A0A5B0WNB6_9GAMM|nr:glucose-6-phosphate isomerase [Pseudohalioglobus sediminis]KAA1188473.1 glucose-6-phosphate isomerase [Pseudohalioglobus sediminis]
MHSAQLLSQLPSYAGLQLSARALADQSIAEMLASDQQRATRFTLEAAGLHLDYSKQLLDDEAMQSLLQLAREAQLPAAIAALLAGEEVNNTEQRPALHTLLRARSAPHQAQRLEEVEHARRAMQAWAERINGGQQQGFSGAVITDVVNIGIGGSDLGPRLVTEALCPFHTDVAVHYAANVDPADLQGTLLNLAPESTLFIICSKSFRTEETLANSLMAREWLRRAGASDNDLDKHFLAITSNLEAAAEFGISPDNCLPMWDWVGGRYSVWSAIGLSCAIAVGWPQFEAFLDGAAMMDQHFAEAPLEANMPVLLSLLEVWYVNFFAAGNHVVLPYDNSLQKLPDFLQQLTMESNGKRVSKAGTGLDYATGPVLWGSAGTMGQHSFHQLLHQGSELCPADFIIPLTTHTGMTQQHSRLVANGLAQSRTLMVGRSEAQARESLTARGVDATRAQELAPHLAMPGNRPNSVITMPALTPQTLGALLALYEHRTYCSGVLWGINSFDQWGVELGKEIGTQILGVMSGESTTADMDPATEQLIARWRAAQ